MTFECEKLTEIGLTNENCNQKGRIKPMTYHTLLLLSIVILVLLVQFGITGCGSDDDDDDDVVITPDSTALSGIFRGGPVEGLAFSTKTHSGTTDKAGTFSYEEGETITFSIGDLVLGAATGDGDVSPIDLVPGATDGSDSAVNNICVLLQSLDRDGHLNNGIQITPEMATIVGKYAFNFDQTTTAFATDAVITLLFAELNSTPGIFNDTDPRDRTLRSGRAAREFLNRCLSVRNTVVTKLGALKGYSADNVTWQYLGIPYATPPLDDLRWRPPQPPKGWNYVRQAIAWGDQAAQDIDNQRHGEGGMSEDCLYLNVTAPKNADNLPVMVWFHGGAFAVLTGNTPAYNNVDALTKKGVILVTVTHRLGPFGYLAHPLLSEESESENGYQASGNYGQMDLVAALKWIQNNIEAFGGNPDNVTIFGQSGGGGKVGLLMASEMANGLFDKAILMSGANAITDTGLPIETILQAGQRAGLALFDRVNPHPDTPMTLNEVRRLPWTAIIEADDAAGITRFAYGPNVDNHFLKDTFYNITLNGLPNDVPLLIGATSGDSESLISGLIQSVPLRKNSNNTANHYVYKFSQVPKGWAKKNLLCGHGVELAYLFNYPASLTKNYEFGNVLDPLTGETVKIDGIDDNEILSDTETAVLLASLGWDAEDNKTADLTMTIWTNFAKYGNPNGPLDASDDRIEYWPAYTNDNDTYAEIENNAATVKTGLAEAFPEGDNVAWLRGQLGDDGDPENGSEIIDEFMTIAGLHTIDYNQTNAAFAADEEIIALLEDVTGYKTRASGLRNSVMTNYGIIRGFEANEGTWQYLGVPYAKPPVGDLRWRPPQPLDAWEGERDALYWGDQAAQFQSYQKYGEGGMSEDCLYLNITAPKNAANLPVMVWFHGGGLLVLTANDIGYNNPEGLPAKEVIQVSVNHRLNFFGYMAHPLLSAESGYNGSGNYGQMDLIAALEWVKNNIEAFGGDPDNVTIFGESGGGRKTLSLMASPQAADLFHKAISQSGTLRPDTRSLADAEAYGIALSDALAAEQDASNLSLTELRALPWTAIVNTAVKAGLSSVPYTNVDNYYLPDTERELIESGQFNDVPFIILVNANDTAEPLSTIKNVLPWLTGYSESNHYATLFTKVPSGWQERMLPAYHACELSYVHNFPESLIAHYQMGLVIDPATGESLAVSDLNENGMAGDPEDIWLSAGWSDADRLVADTAMTLWSNFAKTGDPSIPGVLEWVPYTAGNDLYLDLGASPEMKTGLSELTFPNEPEASTVE